MILKEKEQMVIGIRLDWAEDFADNVNPNYFLNDQWSLSK